MNYLSFSTYFTENESHIEIKNIVSASNLCPLLLYLLHISYKNISYTNVITLFSFLCVICMKIRLWKANDSTVNASISTLRVPSQQQSFYAFIVRCVRCYRCICSIYSKRLVNSRTTPSSKSWHLRSHVLFVETFTIGESAGHAGRLCDSGDDVLQATIIATPVNRSDDDTQYLCCINLWSVYQSTITQYLWICDLFINQPLLNTCVASICDLLINQPFCCTQRIKPEFLIVFWMLLTASKKFCLFWLM